jgi:hypothetical protein
MDLSAEKLVNQWISLRRKRREIERQETAIQTALDILGIRVDNVYGFMDRLESRYADSRPFRSASLAEACLTVLSDHDGLALDKNQMEYFLRLGGYPFDAKDPVNSVEVNLRKLAAERQCEIAEKGLGSTASRYRAPKGKERNAVEDSRATIGPTKSESGHH